MSTSIQEREATLTLRRRYVGRQWSGAWHVLAEHRPEDCVGNPHHSFWSSHERRTACGRTITAGACADTFTDGTPIPICGSCARTIRNVRNAIHNAVNSHNAGFRPALVGGGWRDPLTHAEQALIVVFEQCARERSFDVYLDGPENSGLYLREAAGSAPA